MVASKISINLVTLDFLLETVENLEIVSETKHKRKLFHGIANNKLGYSVLTNASISPPGAEFAKCNYQE